MEFKICENNSARVSLQFIHMCVCVCARARARAYVCFRKEKCFVTNNHEADVSCTSYNYSLSPLWHTLNLLLVSLQLILNTTTSLR
jgi:hypothetical protein